MKEKKLTKEQKENRKHKIEKFKLIGLIISVLINAFFIVSCSVGCASDNGNKEVAAQADEQNAFYQKNNLASFDDLDYFNGSTGYYIKNGDDLYRPSKISKQYVTDYVVSLGSTMSIVVRDSNDSVRALDEQWHVYYHISKPVVTGDYIRFETPNFTRVYSVDISSDTFWLSQEIAPENYTYEQIYLPTYLGYDSPNYQRFREDISTYFKQVVYFDYQLTRSWRPTKSLTSYDNLVFSISSTSNQDLTFINNAIYGNSYALLKDTLFSINGRIYTDLLVHCQNLNNARFYNYYADYTNFREVRVNSSVYFPDYVYAYNNASERSTIIWTMPYEDINNEYHVYSFESNFTNNNLSQIRLFNRHLGYNTTPGYTNGNILDVEGNIISTSTQINGDIGDVFSLFTSAFTGLAGLFSITILPGITVGMLLFLPLVAIIVFAIIKIIKK